MGFINHLITGGPHIVCHVYVIPINGQPGWESLRLRCTVSRSARFFAMRTSYGNIWKWSSEKSTSEKIWGFNMVENQQQWGFIWIYMDFRMFKGIGGGFYQLDDVTGSELAITQVPRRYFASHQPKPVGASVSFASAFCAEDHSAKQKWFQLLFNWSLVHFVEKSEQLYTEETISVCHISLYTFWATCFQTLGSESRAHVALETPQCLAKFWVRSGYPKIMETDHPNFQNLHEIP